MKADTVNKRVLDFVIIGTQKAGTTSLFKYISSHPNVYMPPEKEIPFFTDAENVARGWDWYIDYFFGKAPADKLWGTATPHYMVYPGVAEAMKSVLPGVKLIALIRDPIERAFSHYRMSVKRGYESRSFQQAIEELLEPAALVQSRRSPSPTNAYVTNGEYGRILTPYYELFPPEQIAAFPTTALKRAPDLVLAAIFRHLDIDDMYRPPDLGTLYHQGGERRRTAAIVRLREVRALRAAWHLLPERTRNRLLYWFDQWNTVTEEKKPPVDEQLRERLEAHYARDGEQLATLLKSRPELLTWTPVRS